MFGNTYPYQLEKHSEEICPATFMKEKTLIHTDPAEIHYIHMGLGNNMSLRKLVVEKVGYFKEWLGVGSIAEGGEESELIFRILLSNYTLMTDPKIVVYHNRWLTLKQENFLQARYTSGIMAFPSYYLFGNQKKYAYQFMKFRVTDQFIPMLKKIKYLTMELIQESFFLFLEIFHLLKGIGIGLFMAFRDLFFDS